MPALRVPFDEHPVSDPPGGHPGVGAQNFLTVGGRMACAWVDPRDVPSARRTIVYRTQVTWATLVGKAGLSGCTFSAVVGPAKVVSLRLYIVIAHVPATDDYGDCRALCLAR